MSKKVYFEPAGRINSSRYEFEVSKGVEDKIVKNVLDINLFHLIIGAISKFLPVSLAKAYLERYLKKKPEGTELTFAFNHPVFRSEPYITFVERGYMLLGYDPKHLRSKRYRELIERSFSSSFCKKIVTWSEAAKKSILANFNCVSFAHKIEVVPLSVPKKDFSKNYDNERRIRLLFVGSVNIPTTLLLAKENVFIYDFYMKGGHEVLEALAQLTKKYPNLELIMRTKAPPSMKCKYQGFENIKFIEEILPWNELEKVFTTSDIFVFPARDTVFGAILDAMSYELPIITTNVFANSELVQDGITGFLTKAPKNLPEDYYMGNFSPSQWPKICRTLDPELVEEIVEKVSNLIEHPDLRRRMGKAARWEVEEGKFSMQKRNEQLKRIFDEAIS
jgi:glycosyltransferase involved in cell wall biosynthesis